MSTLIRKLSSRKFLLAVSAASASLADGNTDHAVWVVIAYVLAEAGIDIVATRKQATQEST